MLPYKTIELIQPIISHNITPLVINSLGGGHTHTHTHTHRNQARTGLWPARAWFKNWAYPPTANKSYGREAGRRNTGGF